MSLKTAVLTMLVVGLLQLSSAFILTAPKDDATRMPDFRFKRSSDKYGPATLNTTEGTLSGFDGIKNTTAWGFNQGTDFKAITQMATMPALNVTYPNTAAKFGIFSTKGKKFVVTLGRTPLKITLKATGSDENCGLQVQILTPDLCFNTDASGLGYVGTHFTLISSLRAELETELMKYLKPQLATKLSALEKEVLAAKTDFNKLCVDLLAAAPDNFPQPKFD